MAAEAQLAQQQQMVIRPQSGPQEQFLASSADIVVYGGAAGGGKSFAELIEPLRHVFRARDFGAVIFRRTYPEITAEGSLWDTSRKIYPLVGGTPRESDLSWSFKPYNNTISFGHLEHEKDVHKYQGSQIPLIEFDELTSFTAYQFWYLLSRNRSACGVRPYVRATCNPDPDSWVKELIAWWLDADGEYPDPSKAGVIRWFVRINDELVWASSPEELREKYGPEVMPKSLTFIPAKLSDNQVLERQDPGYRANLMAMSMVERERLLNGNWKIRAQAGTVFRREWFAIVDSPPACSRIVRYWDLAATEPSTSNPDPDYTVGVKLGVADGVFYVLDMVRVRQRPGDVETTIKASAAQDGRDTMIGMEQEGGSSGKNTSDHYARNVLPGYIYTAVHPTGDKLTRAQPVAAAAQNRLIRIVRAPWNTAFLSELEAFPTKGVHDDIVDSLSGAHERLTREGQVEIILV